MSLTLQTKFTDLLAEAGKLLEAGELENAKTKRIEAETVKAQITEWQQIASLQNEAIKMAPARPPLPGVPTHSNVIVQHSAPDSGSGVVSTEERAVKAAYVNYLGRPDEEVDQILTDLHGPHYAKAFWAQKQSFNRYVRYGAEALNGDDRQLLKGIIFTPGAVKTALTQGVSDVATLKTVMVEAADSLGGFTVPVDIQSRIIERIQGKTIVRSKASKETTSRDKIELPRMMDNGSDTTDRYTSPVRVRWVDETPSSLSAQNLTFGMTSLSVHTSMTEAWISRNLLEDTAFGIESYLEKKFAEAAAIDEDDQFFYGDGVGKPRGILPGMKNANSLYRVPSGTASTPFLTWDQLMAMPYQIPRQYRTGNAAWFMNRRTVLALRQLKNASTGDYYWQPFQYLGGAGGQPTLFLDFPIEEHEGMPDLASGSFPIVFGNLEGYTIVDRVGMTVERYLDSNTARQNLVCFVMRRRGGGDLLEKWQLVTMEVAAS